MRALVLAAVPVAFALGGCASALSPSAFADATPEMRPEAFFAGVTTSTGVQEDRGGAPTRRFTVRGSGARLPDGSFRLDQSVTFEHAAAERRTWIMRSLDAHRYAATLTDADGTVEGDAYGNLFHLQYAMRSPPGGVMEQWMYLQPDGRTLVNEATIRVLGIVAARLSERISREGG